MRVGKMREGKREENIMKVCGIHLLWYHNETQNLPCQIYSYIYVCMCIAKIAHIYFLSNNVCM